MTPPIDIRPDHLRIVREVLHRRLPAGVKVWVFGSRAGWATKDSSDLDLALEGETPISRRSLSALETAFEDSDLPYAVDVVDLRRISERFRRIVMKQRAPLPVPPAKAAKRSGRDGWRETALGNVMKLKRGYDLPQRERRAGSVPIVSSSGIISHHSESKVSGPGVVTGRYGTLGQVFYIPEDFWPHNTTLYVQDFKGNDPRFISYFLRSLDFSSYSDKAAVPGLNRNHLHEKPVRVPASSSEQRAIAHVLGTLDDRIELNRRMNKTLEAMARALFKSWFVDFDPVRAKMKGRDTGLPKDVADLFPDRLVDSESGPIPEGWSLGKLDDIASLNPESWNARNAPDEVAYVDLANTKWGRIETVEVHSWSTAPSRARRVLRPGDTIVGTVRPGNGSYALIGDEGLTGSTGFAVLRPRTSNAREIVWCAATCRTNIDRLAHLADGGAYPAIRPHAVAQTRIVLSDISVRRAFSSLTAGWFDRMENDKRASRKLAALRDALLAPLVSGEFRVRHDRMGGLLAVAILQPVERSRNS